MHPAEQPKQLRFRSSNWLSVEQSSEVLKHACGDSMRANLANLHLIWEHASAKFS